MSDQPPTVLPPRIAEAALRLFAERGSENLSVSDLAKAAGVTRATIYNNCPDPSAIFGIIARQLADELHESIARANLPMSDPAERLAAGIGYFLRHAHEQPVWGAFLVRFVLSTDALRPMLLGQPARDIAQGVETGRFSIGQDQIPAVLALIGGGVLSQIALILDGQSPWRKAAADLVELVLRALGLDPASAREIGRRDLPSLGI
ncbi:MAG: TetR/AcrR family transcriptional regulator [Paracoccus sp. (in: a-proteobacteria)]|uniref:TetR/AcrR family transcriptional regulator n=1 Tax=Paracoccus sp. TaxID=267 RepID=UPI0026DFF2A1|nr:TetR/AcrR family transcriptional regulator [Paracoccus sp. (in: a-proteobacteria)]MDO5633053.1 TetR/AcrR family transcriptional regulator [Paracoccus sp. (in: a-proteobacteria)]